MMEEVVITGMGVVSPIGSDESSFWSSLQEGRSGAAAIQGFDTSDLPRSIACQVKEPITLDEPIGRASKLAIMANRQALANAGLNPNRVNGQRFATIVGTTMGETEFIEERLEVDKDEWLSDDHLALIAGAKPGCLSANVQADMGVGGVAWDVYGACAAGNMAMESARRRLLSGDCDVAIAGGADGFSRLAFIGFMRLRVMSAGVCKPFDQTRDGLLVGEGAAMFVLERASSARARGASARARVAGAANACENYHPTRPHPEGDGLTRATLQALQNANLSAPDVDYVCAHGTGTPHNDAIEVKVLEKCFPSSLAFSSIKALTGHTMGAASAMELAYCVLCLEHQTVIPTWHLENVLEPCTLDAVRGEPRGVALRFVLNNAAGFGGYNSSVILASPS